MEREGLLVRDIENSYLYLEAPDESAMNDLLEVQGKHPDQRSGALGPRVSISINTQWRSGMKEIEPIPHEINAQEADRENVAMSDGRT